MKSESNHQSTTIVVINKSPFSGVFLTGNYVKSYFTYQRYAVSGKANLNSHDIHGLKAVAIGNPAREILQH